MDGIVIRDAIGNYRLGDIITGKEMAKFLKASPNTDTYHKVTLPDATPEQPDMPVDKEHE